MQFNPTKLLIAVSLLFFVCSCNTEKAALERKGLMMPKTSEMPRNSKKYTEVNYKNRDKAIRKKQKKPAKTSSKRKKKHYKY